MTGETKLVLYPGLGADARIFAPQHEAFGDRLLTPEWPDMRDAARPWTLREIGARAAAALEREPALAGSAYVVGGLSFGGQVALEAARALAERAQPVIAVALIASCRSERAVPEVFRRRQDAGRWIPAPLVRFLLRGPVVRTFAAINNLSAEHGRLLYEIAAGVNVGLLRKQAEACAQWTFDPVAFTSETGLAIRQIHGSRDPVIPMTPGDPDEVIEGGKHLIHLTHAPEVNAWLSGVLGDEAADARATEA